MKQFRPGSNGHEQFQKEQLGFRAMRAMTDKRRTPIVTQYASIQHGVTFYTILEYANGGDLEAFFRNTNPPTDPRHRHAFWRNILQLFYAIDAIHEHLTDSRSLEPEARHVRG